MAKVEAGKMKLSISSLSMKTLLNDISLLVADLVAKKKLVIELDIAENMPNIEADELKVKRNYIQSALKKRGKIYS